MDDIQLVCMAVCFILAVSHWLFYDEQRKEYNAQKAYEREQARQERKEQQKKEVVQMSREMLVERLIECIENH